jgi:hypothetical protein
VALQKWSGSFTENQTIRLLLKRKQGRSFLGDTSSQVMILSGNVLTAKPKFLDENSEPSNEISCYEKERQNLDLLILQNDNILVVFKHFL